MCLHKDLSPLCGYTNTKIHEFHHTAPSLWKLPVKCNWTNKCAALPKARKRKEQRNTKIPKSKGNITMTVSPIVEVEQVRPPDSWDIIRILTLSCYHVRASREASGELRCFRETGVASGLAPGMAASADLGPSLFPRPRPRPRPKASRTITAATMAEMTRINVEGFSEDGESTCTS